MIGVEAALLFIANLWHRRTLRSWGESALVTCITLLGQGFIPLVGLGNGRDKCPQATVILITVY